MKKTKQILPIAFCLFSCAALPRIETYGFDQGKLPHQWAASVAYYGEAKDWPSLRPTMECILDAVPDRDLMSQGLVVKVHPEAEPGCVYVEDTSTITCGPAPRLTEAAAWRWAHVHSECLGNIERHCVPHHDLLKLRARLQQCEAI